MFQSLTEFCGHSDAFRPQGGGGTNQRFNLLQSSVVIPTLRYASVLALIPTFQSLTEFCGHSDGPNTARAKIHNVRFNLLQSSVVIPTGAEGDTARVPHIVFQSLTEFCGHSDDRHIDDLALLDGFQSLTEFCGHSDSHQGTVKAPLLLVSISYRVLWSFRQPGRPREL